MKKMVWFLALSLVVLIVTSTIGNWEALWKFVTSIPLDRLFSYLGGAATMLIATALSGTPEKQNSPDVAKKK